ncbi:MAG: zinc-binding dehydrogenase [Chloroflexi bacterium]|nr:MAG: zinc-binding dehydrogenase [Chloroflexota bacterium]
MQADVLIECTGVQAATTSALFALGRGGRAVLVGSGAKDVQLPLTRMQSYEIEICGLFRYANTWPIAIALAASGRIDLDRLVTGRFSLAQTEAALTVGSRDPASIKPMISPSL